MLDHDFAIEELLCELVEELVGAHEDTVLMFVDGAGQDRWREHVDYLQSLQRLGREALAAIDVG